jgi:hypothetical protein
MAFFFCGTEQGYKDGTAGPGVVNGGDGEFQNTTDIILGGYMNRICVY